MSKKSPGLEGFPAEYSANKTNTKATQVLHVLSRMAAEKGCHGCRPVIIRVGRTVGRETG